MQNTKIKKNTKNKFGQYFTPEMIADFMIGLADISEKSEILEPCCGEGVFIKLLNEKRNKNITAYEIDDSLINLFSNKVIFESFISAKIEKKFDLIIGNPPYIRWGNLEDHLKKELLNNQLWNQHFNSLCDYLYIFILKSIEQLNENGQLIFICPEYWLNTTHSISLRNYMVSNGYFEDIYHFNETPIFEKVTVSIIIFKYIKSKENRQEKIRLSKYYSSQKLTPQILNALKNKKEIEDGEHFEIDQFKINERWLLAPKKIKEELKVFENKCALNGSGFKKDLFSDEIKYHTIGEICEIGNGLVSGLDKAFQLNGHQLNAKEKKARIKVVKAKDLRPFYHETITDYLFVEDGLTEKEMKENYPNFYEHLEEYKDELLNRYNYNREIKFWEWVFLRNYNLFSKPEPRIFVPCKERISNKDFFRFSFVEGGIYPTQDVTAIFRKENTKESIYYIIAMLNNYRTFHWLKFNGIVKGNIVEFSEKPITSIPIKLIDWKNQKQVSAHNEISALCEKHINTKEEKILEKINKVIDGLF